MKCFALWPVILMISLFTFAFQSARGQTLGTNFTYQGQLKQAGEPLSATADFEFKLFDALTGGSQIGSTVPVNSVNVVDGLFTVSLNFGAIPFNGDNRWLEIYVRSPATFGPFTLLTPRQPLAAAPYALYALSGPGIGGPWAISGNNVFNTNTGNVGIGTSSPVMPLHLVNVAPVMILQDTSTPSQQSGYVGFWNNGSVETAWMGYGTPGSPNFSVVNNRIGGDISLFPGPGGETIVDGNVRLGNTGQFFAPAGEENLRVIRGKVNSNGSTLAGTGFTAVRTSVGHYTVTFNTPFAGTMTMVASPELVAGRPILMIDTVNSGEMNVIIYNVNIDEDMDSAFHFIAIGPR
jgi:hypothetical protein